MVEGWLYTIRNNRFRLQCSRKRYFVLEQNSLKCYKTGPVPADEEPERSAIIDSSIRISDNGRESINRKIFFIFTLSNTLNNNEQLKLGASSPEDAAKWIRALQDATIKEVPCSLENFVAVGKKRWPYKRTHSSKKLQRKLSTNWTLRPSIQPEVNAPDVIAPSPWKIFGCQNGLRLFKEANDYEIHGRRWDDHPAIMAVGKVDASSEAIFWTLMSLSSSRSEWDYCFCRGSVIEHLDGHTDVIYKQLYSDWLPWGMKRRDLLLRRYWRREDDGTYVILYHSVIHKKCPPKNGYIRAYLKSGGFVITPTDKGNQSLVKHMLSIDWKYWKLYIHPASARSITIRMLERVAALRELFKANASSEFSSEFLRDIGSPPPHIEYDREPQYLKTVDEVVRTEISSKEEKEKDSAGSTGTSLFGLQDASDEFFDVPEASEDKGFDHSEGGWSSGNSPQVTLQPKMPSASTLVKKLHEFAVQTKGYRDLQDTTGENEDVWSYGSTLQHDPNLTAPCSWAAADPSTFLIRGETYLRDSQKIKATKTLAQLVGVDWLRSNQREDDLGGRADSIIQKYAAQGRPEFFFVVNIQFPGVTMHNIGLYYMLETPLEKNPLLHNFVNGDDAFRNSRFKLIPYISKGSWIVKQSVGKKSCLIGHALEVQYYRGTNYLEIAIDVGSSTVARGVVNLVLGYLTNLVIEMAFLVQGNTDEELPECLLGTCRLNHLDVSKSVQL